MANKLLIVHGYSDGYVSKESCFRKLQNFLVREGAYARRDIHFVEYASMDDQSTFEDFADKLNADYAARIGDGNRVDVLCHSTGALVTRVWLASRRRWRRERGLPPDSPVHRLFMFAPANFGSDLARMGQSFLGKLRCTFFNKNAFTKDRWESGRIVLQGLEPASPFQWRLSMADLHEETYLGEHDPSGELCLPFVFAAGNGYEKGIEKKVVKERNKPGTDGAIRICGTSLNTRKATLRCSASGPEFLWAEERKHDRMPFAVFQGFNHGSIINPDETAWLADIGPGTAFQRALKVNTLKQYQAVATTFDTINQRNYEQSTGDNGDNYQQFFFRVRDDAEFSIEDYYIDFFVEKMGGGQHKALSREFEEKFKSKFTVHSQDRSMRVFLINLKELGGFLGRLREARATIRMQIHARKPHSEINYDPITFPLYDTTKPIDGQPTLLYRNTTTLIEIVLNRKQSDKVLQIRKSGN